MPLSAGRTCALSLPLLIACACVSDSATGRADRHRVGAVWTGALAQEAERPEQLLPALTLLAVTPLARHQDHHWSQMSAADAPITGAATSRGDGVAVALTLGALGQAGAQWIGGDDGHGMEALTESFLLTEGLTEIIKRTDRRPRPEGGRSSFPSGHTSYAFCMATYLARSIADCGDEWYYDLGYLAYLPAAYVGVNRVEALRHYPSDVTFGAFLGVALTNLIYNAHYGDAEHAGIYGSARESRWQFEPQLGEDGGFVFAMVKRF